MRFSPAPLGRVNCDASSYSRGERLWTLSRRLVSNLRMLRVAERSASPGRHAAYKPARSNNAERVQQTRAAGANACRSYTFSGARRRGRAAAPGRLQAERRIQRNWIHTALPPRRFGQWLLPTQSGHSGHHPDHTPSA